MGTLRDRAGGLLIDWNSTVRCVVHFSGGMEVP
jgi:hypothetical protein